MRFIFQIFECNWKNDFFVIHNICNFKIKNTSVFKSVKIIFSTTFKSILEYIIHFINVWIKKFIFLNNNTICLFCADVFGKNYVMIYF